MSDHTDTSEQRQRDTGVAGDDQAGDSGSSAPEREKLPFMPHEDDESELGDTDQHSTA